MKLVRDKIPALMKGKGKEPQTHVVDKGEYEEALIEKLREELKEVEEDRVVDEVADLIEVAYALGKYYGKSEEEVNGLRKEKNSKNGGFEKRIILE